MNTRRAFTLIELIVVIGVITVLLSIVLFNFLTPVSRSSFASTLNVLVSDLHRQQLKAIQGDSAAPTGPDYYGIHFNADSYVLFSGQTYQVADPGNVTVQLDPSLRFSFINLPGSEIIFSPGSGEFSNFVAPDTDDFTLIDIQSSLIKVIDINPYGVVTQIY